VSTLSTESIASQSPTPASATATCASCGAVLAADQRYCLQCGERCVPVSEFLLGGTPVAAGPSGSEPAAASPSREGAQHRNQTLNLIAGVGVLLLAVGVGVLIGRSYAPKQSVAPAQVISVGSSTGASSGTAPNEAAFTGNWPSGETGYTVQLQTLPQTGTPVSAVEAAKAGASAKGAKAVGALESAEFSSLPTGSFVIYSGEYRTHAEAQKALAALKQSFPTATVIHVSNGGAGDVGSSAGAAGSTSSGGGVGKAHAPPPPASLDNEKGKSYEEKSKALPDEVET
jgi:hypothetical protein